MKCEGDNAQKLAVYANFAEGLSTKNVSSYCKVGLVE
jgi:hypothetical protein